MYELKRDDVLDDYRRFLKVERGLSEKTIHQHATMLQVFLDRYEQIRPAQELAKEFQEHLMDEGYSNSHINNTMKAIEYYFDSLGRTDELPASERRSLPRKRTEPNPLSEDEVREILGAAKTYRDTAILRVLVSSGIRKSELANLDISDVDLERRRLTIREGKGNKDRTAIVSSKCADAIETYLLRREDVESDALFLSRYGNRLTPNGVYQLVKRTVASTDIERNVKVHTFRATFAQRLKENGADIYRIKELLGHDDIRSTMIYLRMEPDELGREHDKYYVGY
ncbi:integrase/recombinase XerD [Halopelagius inordinatus]|uniref:Integrase/recombinase XerD n=1 Tax=Halopelagius inordinatus TaxID=553467 RepID=A0A1I2MDS6_9EURY|nr:tyrosine-type recombinase/integrase [Halopelagius inordinatus]SFF87546.1 integrase/recombinase XerD [Halopelagius inordinatus]